VHVAPSLLKYKKAGTATHETYKHTQNRTKKPNLTPKKEEEKEEVHCHYFFSDERAHGRHQIIAPHFLIWHEMREYTLIPFFFLFPMSCRVVGVFCKCGVVLLGWGYVCINLRLFVLCALLDLCHSFLCA